MIIGLVGKPSCGKSTFFKAVTLADVEIANYPFTTIKKNEGVGFVKIDCVDKFFNVQCNPRHGFCTDHKRFVPVQIIDVAGLVPDAHLGKGMGNQFLDDLRQADVLIHVVDMSGSLNERGESVDRGSYDPANDIKFLEYEIDMWYYGILKKGWDRFARQVKQEKIDVRISLTKQLSGLGINEGHVEEVIRKLKLDKENVQVWTDEDLMNMTREFRHITKPIIIAANKMDIEGAEENYKRIKEEFSSHIIVPCSAESELALKEAAKRGLIDYVPGENDFKIIGDLSEAQKKGLGLIKEKILDKFNGTGVQRIMNSSVFDLLKYIAIFPGGVNKLQDSDGRVLPDCFLMPPNSTALDFAFKLHSDFGNNFIKAVDVKTRMVVGKDHKLKNLDVVEIASGK